MKYVTAFLLLALSFSSCTFDYNDLENQYLDSVYSDRFKNVPLYYGDFSDIHCINDIPMWMSKHIKYVQTFDIKTPQQVIESSSGDCDGFTLVYANIAYVRFGLKYSTCLTLNQRKVVEGGRINHAVLRDPSGKVIEPQTGKAYTQPVGYEYSFDHVFILSK